MPTGLGDEQLWLSATNDNTGTSTAFNDQSGQGNNGTASGTTVVADTSEGGTYAFDFDGTDDRITVPQANFDFLRETNYFSTSAWVKADSVSGQRTIIGGDLNTANHGIFVADDAGSGGVRGARSDGATPYSPDTKSSTSLTTSQWTHVCWVVDNTTSTLYLDGVQIFQETGTFQTSTGSLTDSVFIGCFISGGTLYSFWDGLQDDIRIYDRALTQSEITHLAEARGVEGPPPVGLGDEKLWLCPSINNSANDISGNGNDGTYNGGMGTVTDTDSGGTLAYDFDGTDDHIDISGFNANTSTYSVSCWINGTGPNQTTVAFNSGDSSGGRATNIGLETSGTALTGHQNGGSSYWAESTSSVNGSGWKHVAYTFDGSTVEIFIDGVSEDTQAASATNKTQALAYIGRWVGPTPFWLTGKMDDIRAYDRALTQAEITHLATNRGVLGAPGGATHYNPFKSHAFTNNFQQRLR